MTRAMQQQARPEASAPDELTLKRAFGSFATGVSIVTAKRADGTAVGLTVNSLSSVSMQPPLLLWCLNKRSPNLEVFQNAKHHAISILAEKQHALAYQFAKPSEDKFKGVAFECINLQQHDAGDHVIFIGQVVGVELDAGHEAPLVCHRSRFVRLEAVPA
jgi:3-hydroxy-9,10-secoandrosta-1,3,5(10)-triene-9,17-dione monooxygenase reductase component